MLSLQLLICLLSLLEVLLQLFHAGREALDFRVVVWRGVLAMFLTLLKLLLELLCGLRAVVELCFQCCFLTLEILHQGAADFLSISDCVLLLPLGRSQLCLQLVPLSFQICQGGVAGTGILLCLLLSGFQIVLSFL
ncbi:hypothetical protein GE09DRAFT_1160614 [Coniochaeta sp. 2T2.1]|nr:hypothetical protein GE09DRAFT_1160614 [Coniochaeta sp. 2T2.1]